MDWKAHFPEYAKRRASLKAGDDERKKHVLRKSLKTCLICGASIVSTSYHLRVHHKMLSEEREKYPRDFYDVIKKCKNKILIVMLNIMWNISGLCLLMLTTGTLL